MARFIFLTKTLWDEPPRMRHQLARLLANGGHDVFFFEKPTAPWRSPGPVRHATERITVTRHRELIHHKLRVGTPFQWLNARFTMRSIERALLSAGPVDVTDVIVNFNYDYWFLRGLFPCNVIVTMINDDFVSRGPLGITWHLRRALARTCRMSDKVLTVSTRLQHDLSPYTTAVLFLPWADRPYRQAVAERPRDVLLFWGFINRRIDFDLVEALARRLATEQPDVRLVFAGPVEQGVWPSLTALAAHGNIEIQPALPLDKLPLDRVFASIIPYVNAADVDACMLPNKALLLLARGIPLLISGLPHFIEAPFVVRIDSSSGSGAVNRIRLLLDSLQPAISTFVGAHQSAMRLRQFEEIAGVSPVQ